MDLQKMIIIQAAVLTCILYCCSTKKRQQIWGCWCIVCVYIMFIAYTSTVYVRKFTLLSPIIRLLLCKLFVNFHVTKTQLQVFVCFKWLKCVLKPLWNETLLTHNKKVMYLIWHSPCSLPYQDCFNIYFFSYGATN